MKIIRALEQLCCLIAILAVISLAVLVTITPEGVARDPAPTINAFVLTEEG